MIDRATQEPIQVHAEGDAGPYLMVDVDQLDEVRILLDRNGIRYWVDEDAISLDGKPAVTVINFGRGTDANRVQHLLDAA